MPKINRLQLSSYLLGISMILIIISIGFYYHQLKSLEKDGELINTSGKQRMLSQKISKHCILLVYDSISVTTKEENHKALNASISEFKKNYDFIKKNTELKSIYQKIEELEKKLDTIVYRANKILLQSGKLSSHLNIILETEQFFLPQMDHIVDLYTINYNKKRYKIGYSILTIGSLKVLLLLYIVFFLLLPEIRKVRNQNSLLEEQNKELKQFVFIASHDLHEPMRTVSSFISLIKNQYEDKFDEKGIKYLKFIDEASIRMRSLIKALLDYGRLGVDKKLELVNTQEVLKKILEDLKRKIDEKNAVIHYNNLPTLKAYRVEIRLLLQNLISNALKFHKPDEHPKIEITAEKVKGYYVFKVTDYGIGIDKKFFDKVFQMFQQLHNKNKYEGLGIGLANCQKLVGIHQGKIWIESEQNKYTTFYFTIKEEIT